MALDHRHGCVSLRFHPHPCACGLPEELALADALAAAVRTDSDHEEHDAQRDAGRGLVGWCTLCDAARAYTAARRAALDAAREEA